MPVPMLASAAVVRAASEPPPLLPPVLHPLVSPRTPVPWRLPAQVATLAVAALTSAPGRLLVQELARVLEPFPGLGSVALLVALSVQLAVAPHQTSCKLFVYVWGTAERCRAPPL